MSHATRRRALIAKIHIARTQLGLDETTYRLLLRRYGAESAALMRLDQLDGVLKELQAKGWQPAPPRKAGKRRQAQGAEVALIRALWLFLHDLGEVDNPSEAALAAYAKRIAGIDDLHWADGHRRERIIETLKKWAARVLPARLEARLTHLEQTGRIPPDTTLAGLLLAIAQTRRPDTYAALRRVWDHLSELDHDPA